MPRKARVEYPGAMYHVMCRGDRREDIFLDDIDRHDFIAVRLRKETTLTVKAIAARVHLGTSRSAGARLQEWTVSRAPAESAQGELAI